MTTDDNIIDEKLQYDINRKTAISALSSGKTDKYQYLASEGIQNFDQKREI